MAKAVAISSWFIRSVAPALASQRSRVSRAAASMAGARALSRAGWKAGAAARRCHRQWAPSATSSPSPSVGPSTRRLAGVLPNNSARRTSTSWISSGSMT